MAVDLTTTRFSMMMPMLVQGLLYAISVCDGANYTDLQRLHDSLLTYYRPNLRPVNDSSRTVLVNMDIAVFNIVTLDLTSESLVTWLELVVTWTDERLTWNADQYTDVRAINFPRRKLWVSDVHVLNAHRSEDILGDADNTLQVYPDGKVQWFIDLETRTPCPVSLTRFPFDKHTCSVTLTTAYHGEVDVNISDVTFTDEKAIKTGEWMLTTSSAKRVTLGEHRPKSGVTVSLTLRRHGGYYIFCLILPLFIVAVVNPCVILVRSNSGEKTSTAVTLFLSFTIFITLLADLLPQSSRGIPVFTVLVYMQFLFSSGIVAYCIVSQRLSQRYKHNRLTRILALVLLKTGRKKAVQPATTTGAGDGGSERDPEEFTDFLQLADKLDSVVFCVCTADAILVMNFTLLSLLVT
ncbi:5-hydroxytryptamine receptor 3A-like [Haliotis rubra]|uniref:5-hydroxytryptamine receptor 3A-like n=1 Tax=Haliotis rubra TaxID=36100 RepID=UPI001EE63367|nr:5-hydroxytryptamine receptor 3A-like [Haliotis rubra]